MRFLALLSSLCTLASCRTPDTFTEADQQRVSAEVDSMLHAYPDALREGGLAAEFAYLDSTDAFFWVPPGYDSWISYDSVETVIRATAPTLRSIDYRWRSLRIDPISQDRAIYTSTPSGALTDTSGRVTNISIIETGTVSRHEEGWKLLKRLLNYPLPADLRGEWPSQARWDISTAAQRAVGGAAGGGVRRLPSVNQPHMQEYDPRNPEQWQT